jgi:hypothetical protein
MVLGISQSHCWEASAATCGWTCMVSDKEISGPQVCCDQSIGISLSFALTLMLYVSCSGSFPVTLISLSHSKQYQMQLTQLISLSLCIYIFTNLRDRHSNHSSSLTVPNLYLFVPIFNHPDESNRNTLHLTPNRNRNMLMITTNLYLNLEKSNRLGYFFEIYIYGMTAASHLDRCYVAAQIKP